MGIVFNIPPTLEEALKNSGLDPAAVLKEAALVEMYRMGQVSHGELAEGLGVSRLEVDAILRRHGVTEDLPTCDEVEAQLAKLRKLAG